MLSFMLQGGVFPLFHLHIEAVAASLQFRDLLFEYNSLVRALAEPFLNTHMKMG